MPAPDPAIEYLTDLLEDTREELGRADAKAALLLAGAGVAVGALLAGLLNGRWVPFALDNRIEWLWWLGVASTAAGIYSIAAAVYPRIQRSPGSDPGTLAYYGDVAAYKDIDSFRRAIEQPLDPRKRLMSQTYVVCKIAQRKYMLIQHGMRFLAFAILACTAAILINIPLSR